MDVDANHYDDATLFQTLETRDSLRVTGICTSAGRGKRLPAVNPSEHIQVPPMLSPTSGVGRAAFIKNMRTMNQTNQRREQQRDPFDSQLQSQLRQVTGEGFSNAFIEHNFPNASSTGASEITPLPVLAEKPDSEEQFEDAPVQMIPSTSTLPEAGISSKAKGGNGRKGRVFRKVPFAPAISESYDSPGNGNGNGKKLISDIFKQAPVDYKQSYFSNKKDKFKLQSKDDFPTL